MASHHSAVLRAATQDTSSQSSTTTNLTFISIHDLTEDARILYSSDSIIDVLGYTPDEVVNHSIWDFVPKEELPYAKLRHKRGVEMDKAAVLVYCRVRDSAGDWVGCECCFTIVYDVMVVCTSIYRNGMSSQKRAIEAPIIRRMFSSSPLDPRYHMLSHVSDKFKQPSKQQQHEPRAALFLNRFTRTLTIMYATSGIEEIIGISSQDLQGRSFYYCIAENCLSDAVRCLENAKGNDSIAYMRFWFRDPRQNDPDADDSTTGDDSDEEMTTTSSVDQDMDGGVHLTDGIYAERGESPSSVTIKSESSMDIDDRNENGQQSRTSSGDSANPPDSHEAIFGTSRPSESSVSSAAISPERRTSSVPLRDIELEAVVSCASDGLVVCLRRARPVVPLSTTTRRPHHHVYENGLFAAPWADDPIVPLITERPNFGLVSPFAPSLSPQGARNPIKTAGPSRDDFMSAIREQAVFAWALTGINGSLSSYASGVPFGESVPSTGLPIWQPEQATAAAAAAAAVGNDHRRIFGDPGLRKQQYSDGHVGGGVSATAGATNTSTSVISTASHIHTQSPSDIRTATVTIGDAPKEG